MTRTIPMIIGAFMLSGCTGAMGWEAHDYNMGRDLLNTEQTMQINLDDEHVSRVEIWFRDLWEAQRLCMQLMTVNTEPLGCAVMSSAMYPPRRKTDVLPFPDWFPENIDCLIIVPPNRTLYKHEMRHCEQGHFH